MEASKEYQPQDKSADKSNSISSKLMEPSELESDEDGQVEEAEYAFDMWAEG